MLRFEVKIPDPISQHLKNWKIQIVPRTIQVKNELGLIVEREIQLEEPVVKTRSPDGRVEYEMGGAPVWGLGCPAGCGRFWEFIAENDHYRPVDSVAYSGIDDKGRATKGYLNYRTDPTSPSVRMFTCDRCGSEVRLTR
jgi:hypothetical protein